MQQEYDTYILNELLLPPSDIIKFRVESEQTRAGTISLEDGINRTRYGPKL